MRVPAGTSTARNGTAAVGGGANSDHAATVTRIAPASHLERGGRSNQAHPEPTGRGRGKKEGQSEDELDFESLLDSLFDPDFELDLLPPDEPERESVT